MRLPGQTSDNRLAGLIPVVGAVLYLASACEVTNPAFNGVGQVTTPLAGTGGAVGAAGMAGGTASGGTMATAGFPGTGAATVSGGVAGTAGVTGAAGAATAAGGTAGSGTGGTAGSGIGGAAGILVGGAPGQLVAHYLFNEAADSLVLVDAAGGVPDSATLAQDNTNSGYQAGRNAPAGQTFWLNDWPTSPFFQAQASSDFNSVRTAVTVMAWVKMGGSGWRVIAERPRGVEPNWGLYVTYQDAVEFDAGSTPYYFLAGRKNRVQVGVWTHIAASYDTTTGVAKVYVNGRVDGTTPAFDYGTAFAFDPGPGGNNEPFFIGKTSCPDCSRSMTGAIDDLRVYNVALTDAAIAQIAAGN